MPSIDAESKNETDGQHTMISVNLREQAFTISGSEKFVLENRDLLFAFFERNKSSIICNIPKENAELVEQDYSEPREVEEIKKQASEDKYQKAGLYTIENGSVIIHKKRIPGNKAEQMRKIAFIVLYALNNEPLSSSVLQNYCEIFDCYDKTHVARNFESEREYFTKKTIGRKNWSITLTPRGLVKSTEILDEMMPSA